MKSYSHLTVFHRQMIGTHLKQGRPIRQIARILGVSPSTVSREIKRNKCGFGYCCHIAHQAARSRRADVNRARRKIDPEAQSFIEKQLREQHSPEQIASGFPEHLGRTITAQSIYRFLRSYEASRLSLRPLLRRKGKRYMSRSSRKAVCGNRPSIDTRPPEINDRRDFGHWEADLMEGPRGTHGALLVLVERKSRFVLTRFIRHSTADAVATAIVDLLKNFIVHSITYDNGPPFAYYKRVEAATGSSAFFCHPYHAWEKGTVENTIGLLREYHPKKTPISDCRQLHLSIRTKLNNRPRRTLEFRTPASFIDNLRKVA